MFQLSRVHYKPHTAFGTFWIPPSSMFGFSFTKSFRTSPHMASSETFRAHDLWHTRKELSLSPPSPVGTFNTRSDYQFLPQTLSHNLSYSKKKASKLNIGQTLYIPALGLTTTAYKPSWNPTSKKNPYFFIIVGAVHRAVLLNTSAHFDISNMVYTLMNPVR